MKHSIMSFYPKILFLLLGVFLIGPYLIQWLWGWTIPDLFPGAVENGLIAKNIPWLTGLKVSILIAFLVAVSGVKVSLKDFQNYKSNNE
ncbi:hypothetical protein KAU43_02610 [candidate division WOR-3 bacterium]|jgi:flagellar biosynthesis protein FliQ|nr:hypothetical protein [candidate division WOR-3 bacterium]